MIFELYFLITAGTEEKSGWKSKEFQFNFRIKKLVAKKKLLKTLFGEMHMVAMIEETGQLGFRINENKTEDTTIGIVS